MGSSELIGRSAPLGAKTKEFGVNFSLFSRLCSGVELLLFEHDDASPIRVIQLDPYLNCTYFYWHVFVPGVRPGQIYGYRVKGEFTPEKGLRFDPSKVLLDPYARGVRVSQNYCRRAASMS